MSSEIPSILPYLTSQLRAHPSMTPLDVAKLCYQAAYGAEHLLADPERARGYLARELDSVTPCEDVPLAEAISPEVCRVNLAPWKARGLSADRLFAMFSATASVTRGGRDLLLSYLEEAEALILTGDTSVSPEAWREFMTAYEAAGYPAVHHSEAYRAAESPAYRIVLRDILSREGYWPLP